jgi:3-isopropylmalate/(R)-2-methylmalate dehydratase large subunit
MGKSLYDKVFDRHTVRQVAPGQYQLMVALHLLNEVSSPQAFEALRERGLPVRYPGRTFSTADHSISTNGRPDEFSSEVTARQVATMARNAEQTGIRYYDPAKGEHGIIHVLAPERGLTLPGMVIVCGDSHTSTHGAFGCIAFGIGTSQVRDVLATQTLLMERLKVRRIEINGALGAGVYAKDVALHVIRRLGARGGVGFAYEFTGTVVEAFSMEERMTLCNLAVEGGARCGYVNPDEITFAYLRGREYAPPEQAWDSAVAHWRNFASDDDASYDDRVVLRAEEIAPMVTWGTSPHQSCTVDETTPSLDSLPENERIGGQEALRFMDLQPSQSMVGTKIDVAFIGSCTNGRLSDYEAVAEHLAGRDFHVAPHVKALIVPGSRQVRDALIAKGLDKIFIAAGFEFRDAGCSLCCGMNSDSLTDGQTCASSSNRNFKGRQGSPSGRTILMSPVMVAAAAIAGEVADARRLFARSESPSPGRALNRG